MWWKEGKPVKENLISKVTEGSSSDDRNGKELKDKKINCLQDKIPSQTLKKKNNNLGCKNGF